MIAITGLGRCGTSALARFCREIGSDPGGKWDDHMNAGLEDEETTRINQLIRWFADGVPRDDNRDILENLRDIKDRILSVADKKVVVKDPNFALFQPLTISVWASVLDKNFKIIYLNRDAENIRRSRGKSGGYPPPGMGNQRAIDILSPTIGGFFHAVACWGIPIRIFNYPDFIDQYDKMANCLSEFGLNFDRELGRRAWEKVMDKKQMTIWR